MLETKKCKECGADVAVDYIKPCMSFRIEDGEIIRDDNNDAWEPRGDGPYVVFYCSEDREHEIGDIDVSYMEQVEEEIIKYLSSESDF
jgi:hypothetical protein